MKNILIIKLGALGDILFISGIIKEIRRVYPDSRISLLTTSSYRRLMADCPWIDEVIVDPRKPRINFVSLIRFLRDLKSRQFDLIYDLQQNRRTRLYRRFIKTKWLFNWHSILSELGYSDEVTHFDFKADVTWMVDDATDILKEFKLNPGYVFLIPGGSARHPQKRWPFYGELARNLIAKGFQVAVAPGPDELDLCRKFPCHVILQDGKPVSMRLLAGIIQQARFVIGNDTGPMHLAAYLGRPGLALFGSHASASAVGLDRYFDVLEVQKLSELAVETVEDRIEQIFFAHQNSS